MVATTIWATTVMKKKYNNYVVIVKDKGFYNCFGEDAIVIWNLMRYKYKDNNSVSFGSSGYPNVIDMLDRLCLNYVIYDEEEKAFNNYDDNRFYDCILISSKENYSRFEKELLIKNKVEKILKTNDSNINRLEEFLNGFVC